MKAYLSTKKRKKEKKKKKRAIYDASRITNGVVVASSFA